MTEPYYSDESVTLYHGDCREITEWLAADALVTDPPYGMAYVSNMNRDRRNVKVGRPVAADTDTSVRDAVLERWGSKGPALVFGTWRVNRPVDARAMLIWHKLGAGGMGDLTLPWLSTHEEIYALGGPFIGKRQDAVYPVRCLMSNDAERPDHPTPKPIPLMERLLLHTEGVVADPFAGSGSTLIAARNLGRRAIGVELEERYCEIAVRRLAQGVLDFEGVS